MDDMTDDQTKHDAHHETPAGDIDAMGHADDSRLPGDEAAGVAPEQDGEQDGETDPFALDVGDDEEESSDGDALAESGDSEVGDSEVGDSEVGDADSESDPESDEDAEEAAAAYARASMSAFDAPPPESEISEEGDESQFIPHRGEKPRQLVVVNDAPGDEMRIAILDQGRLGQFYSERASTATNVGSIYKARVVNVEPAIQAAFVDFGEGANGFLHISDLHPKYFPAAKGGRKGEDGDAPERTEKVGRKIPRRSRPLMQDALKRGQEIVVQVLKEGLGSKGPTVTSYLSIPGRLLVMMPDMDNVGVSRKVDDEDSRRRMRKILDSLDLREGFGFILRTAGFEATRTELARDAQYLTRLWDVMEKRMKAVGAPCQLYAEGDILLRTIRDSIDASVDGIVVDSEASFHRAKAFLEVVAPKAAARVHFYDRKTPIFHAFDAERQVDLIHAREVPLPSGGALVFDQAEALVAIDVNSGRSRSARDSETNAYQTNQEAVDEIARQLRLRDLGGVVVCDLIDMRSAKHRRDIEERFKKNLAKDRAKTTVSQIGDFGIIELTRQRMRPSIRKAHYMDCPHCAGLGEIRMPDSVASDAMRRIQLAFDTPRVARVEVVCSARVAGAFLSARRRAMSELEDLFSKKIEVRISDAIAADRVEIYGYDERGNAVEPDRSRKPMLPSLESFPTDIEEGDAEGEGEESTGESTRGEGGGRKRRRRRRKPVTADATSIILSGGFDDLPEVDEEEETISQAIARDEQRAREDAKRAERRDESDAESPEEGEAGGRRGKRRRRRRGRGGDRAESQTGAAVTQSAPTPPPPPREPSDPIRVHAIAKEIELTSKEVLAKCAELEIEVKGHQSLLTGEQGDAIRKAYGKPPFDVPEPAPVPVVDPDSDDSEMDGTETAQGDEGAVGGEGGARRKRKRRRRGRGGRDGRDDRDGRREDAPSAVSADAAKPADRDDDGDSDDANSDGDAEAGGDGDSADGSAQGEPGDGGENRRDGGRRKRRRRRGGRGRDRDGQRGAERNDRGAERNDRGGNRPARAPSAPSAPPAPAAPAPAPKPRSLYGGRVRKLAPHERPKGGDE
jgi:ribonuclease E